MSATNSPITILVVEDESIVAMDLSEHLQEMGYRVCGTADSGKLAIELARTQQPDLILMDIVIKGDLDGIQTAEMITRAQHIPIIFLTAYSDARTVERAAKTAPYGYLTKPFQGKELRAAIEVALYKSLVERRLRTSEKWFSSTLRCVADGVIATDPDSRIRFMNPAAEALTGWRSEDATGRAIDEVFVLCDQGPLAQAESIVHRAIRENIVMGVDYAAVVESHDGTRWPVDHSVAPIRDDQDQVMGAVVVFREVSRRLKVEQSLKSSEERFRNAFDFAPVGMALVALDGRFLQVNDALCELFGMTHADFAIANHRDLTHADDVELEHEQLTALLTGATPATQFEKRYQFADREPLWTLVSISLLKGDEEPNCYLYQVHDLSQRKQTELQLAKLAHFDPLTGLANRTRLREESERILSSARRHGESVAVMFLDLDHFKFINDSLGHDAGDQMLVIIADRLTSSVRETDLVARIGGDEFVILLGEIKTPTDISVITQKILQSLSMPWQLNGRDLSISTSIGISVYPEDGTDISTLFRHADSALYDAKAEGRNKAQFYRAELGARVESRLKLESALRVAVKQQEFVLFFQPIIDVQSRQPVSVEALVRWRQTDGGMIGPDVFIPLAEETGMIVDMGAWILHTACTEAVRWQQSGRRLAVSVNISPRQFKAGNLLEVVQSALDQSGLEPTLLCLEITEQLVLDNTEINLSILKRLKEKGITISIDDFGVGYSSLSYIKRFDPRSLKIDRSFVTDVVKNQEDAVIVRAIIAMSKQLRIRVIAEGVETAEALHFLREVGCDEAQGYFIARPCDSDTLLAWLLAYEG